MSRNLYFNDMILYLKPGNIHNVLHKLFILNVGESIHFHKIILLYYGPSCFVLIMKIGIVFSARILIAEQINMQPITTVL